MTFASPPPAWLAIAVGLIVAGLAYAAYRDGSGALSRSRRAVLMTLRALVLVTIALLLCRPVVERPGPDEPALLPVLVDTSRSMRVEDMDGRPRLAAAMALLEGVLLPPLAGKFIVEPYTVGDALRPAAGEELHPRARQSDLTGALAAVRTRYRGQRVAGIVLLSDGADTGDAPAGDEYAGEGPPVVAVGFGSPSGMRDREVVALAAGDPRLDRVAVDLHATFVSRGYGSAPFDVQVLADGRPVETRRVVPAADGVPVDAVFTVLPDPQVPTVFAVSIVNEGHESITENDARSVLVNPAGRPRRVLVLQGAPGFEHSFVGRVWAVDSGLEVDTVVRKGRDDSGRSTFLVQAGSGRVAALAGGFPSTREALYRYDAVIVGNFEGEAFARTHLDQLADFVSARGGGLLVFGGRSFAGRGLSGTAIEAALPVDLNDRRGLSRASFAPGPPGEALTVLLTSEGARHPVMRVGSPGADVRRLWATLPPLSAAAPLGGPRAGASVLAVTETLEGTVQPLVAVQRYGRGRSMVFSGEASWRWRMLMPASDRTYEYFWRQAVRWLAGPAPDPVSLTLEDGAEPGDTIEVGIDARDSTFVPVPDALVETTLTGPGGDAQTLAVRPAGDGSGAFVAVVRPERPGLYRVRAEAHAGETALGVADRWFHVGGSDREFSDPRLNEGFLRRLADASGGRYVHASQASDAVEWLQAAASSAGVERRDLWNHPAILALIMALLAAEWVLRRRWGLR